MSTTTERRASEQGFTIVELIVSMALLWVVLAGVVNSTMVKP